MATTNEQLPEDIIVQILYRLPVKPLIRFSCVSKRWSSIISDPQFAKSHFKLASARNALSRRLLLSTRSQFESLDVQTPSFVDDSSVRKLACPFKQPGCAFKTLGSCNGMVFVALDFVDRYYIWNPSTGLFLKLPNPDFASIGDAIVLHHCGFGYVSASDDYKLVVAAQMTKSTVHLEMFSSRADSWKRIESPPPRPSMNDLNMTRGSLTNEALHWLHISLEPEVDTPRHTITAFDLAKEQFREIPLPRLAGAISDSFFFIDVGIVFEGCLCVSRYEGHEHGGVYVQLWVMMEYDVRESWTKLFKFDLHNDLYMLRVPIFYTERRIVMWGNDKYGIVNELKRFDHEKEDKLDKVAVCTGRYILAAGCRHMIEYDETLLWLRDSRAEGGKTTQNPTHARKLK